MIATRFIRLKMAYKFLAIVYKYFINRMIFIYSVEFVCQVFYLLIRYYMQKGRNK